MSIFTVGNEVNYDRGILVQGSKFLKVGRRDGYPGGFACKFASDAARLIAEFGKCGEWAVYEILASWDTDTAPSANGWWHALIHDSVVIRKVESASKDPG